MKRFREFILAKESAPVNSVGGGNIAGIVPGEAPPEPLSHLFKNQKFKRGKDPLKKYRTIVINKQFVGSR